MSGIKLPLEGDSMVVGDREYQISRVFDAPRSLVYRAWTDPKQMAKWWGPKMFTNPVCEMDVRVGGRFRIVMRGPEGDEFPFKGVYLEIVENELLKFTDDCTEHPKEWHDLVHPGQDPTAVPEVITTVTFTDADGKTRVTVHMRFETPELRDGHVSAGMDSGWSESFVSLAELLAGEEPSGKDPLLLTVTRRFKATAEQVYDAWLDPEVVAKWLFATPGGEMLRVEIDARVGGRFVVVERRGEVEAYHGGEYVALVRPKFLAFSFAVNPELTDAAMVKVDITETDDGCEVVLTQAMEQKFAEYFERSKAGWETLLGKLAGVLGA